MGIAGAWYNELGSMVEFIQNADVLTGTYQTAVGDASGNYDLSGRIDSAPSAGGQAVGWVVSWTNVAHGSSHSVTSWSGQLQTSSDGAEEIVTFWLLTSEQLPQSDWSATNVGQDVFTRSPPTAAQISAARKRRNASNPARSSKKQP
jgi:hypothetical protein